jgi:hypothetical protein
MATNTLAQPLAQVKLVREVQMRSVIRGLAALALASAFAGAAAAEEMTMNVELTGAEQVPPVETTASGTAEVTFNSETRMLTWELDHEGLEDVTAAHFHGPADEGENAPPVVPIEDPSDGAEGSAELTEEQSQLLMDGKMYINVHTAAHPDGEIRGQVKSS